MLGRSPHPDNHRCHKGRSEKHEVTFEQLEIHRKLFKHEGSRNAHKEGKRQSKEHRVFQVCSANPVQINQQ